MPPLAGLETIIPDQQEMAAQRPFGGLPDYCDSTGDKVTFEYVLLKGVTDSLQDAWDLHELTKDIPCKINIIPFNEHPNSGFQRPSGNQIDRFQRP